MSRKQDRERLTQRLVDAWTTSQQEATEAGHPLTVEDDLVGSLLDMGEALGSHLLDEAQASLLDIDPMALSVDNALQLRYRQLVRQRDGWGRPRSHIPWLLSQKLILEDRREAWAAIWAGPEPRRPTCVVCGQTFGAWRSDARTCSPTCRQRAYRSRGRPVTVSGA